jgi:predicted pyridoxine 5'-phosphate oxidase superfamily flavin-nucleotide-binding protein
MTSKFAEINFTAGVKAAQERYGSRDANRVHELGDDAGEELTARETQFIAARDSFYQATVSESGWPYVQHRGGPAGFLKVLDDHTIAYADFRGNIQYLSVGNLGANDRVSLILVDYANRRRLKIWGRAQIVEAVDDPALISRLESPGYRARVERGIVIRVEAWDWNCPQHITQRYSRDDVDRMTAPLVAEIQRLKQRIGDTG